MESLHVLMIDDDPADAYIVERCLESIPNVRFEHCRSHDELQNLDLADFDLLVLDYMLGDTDGIKVLEKIRESGNELPVAVLSGCGDDEVAAKTVFAGADDYLSKSALSPESIRKTVNRAIARFQERAIMKKMASAQTKAVEQLERLNLELMQSSRTDGLTGLLIRHAWFEAAQLELERSRRYRHPCTLIMLDIDHFKLLNDSFGHLVGDECLRQISSHVLQSLRNTDIAGRYGGEEFVAILPETSLSNGLILANRLCSSAEELKIRQSDQASFEHVTISAGLAELREGEELEEFIDRADQQLYRAKKGGRNQVCS